MFKSKLYNILDDLQSHSKDRNEIFQKSIEERLEKSLNSYNEQMLESYKYLSTKKEINVLKKINRSMHE